MNKPTVDELLTGSAPAFSPSRDTESALDALVFETRSAEPADRAPRPRRALWLAPGAVLAVAALTAGAVLVDEYARVDVPIAVEYTTDTGTTVACTATIQGGSFFAPKPTAVIDYYRTHDFAGIGQKIYSYALVLAGDVPGTAEVLPESSSWLPGDDWAGYSDESALSQSMVDFLLLDVIKELGLDGVSGSADLHSDCTGQLH